MTKNGHILIIDDNPKNIQVAASILEQAGYTCEFALDGASGLNWLETDPFDLVLLDVMMPGEDGFDICRLIKSHPTLNKIPVVFLTAKIDRESMVTGFEAGGADYITKPFDAKELVVRVKNHIELKINRELLEGMNEKLECLVEEKTNNLSNVNKKLESVIAELTHSNDNLKRLEESKQQFLNILGTEVSGSLNEVTGMLQVVKYKVDSKKVAQLIDRVDHALSKIETFVNAGLRITELQSKGSMLKPERVDLNKLIGYALFQLDEKIRRKQININNQGNSLPVFVTGESQLLMSAFVIVLDFFLERNLANASLSVELLQSQQGVTIIFTDDGRHVSESDINSYFDIYFPGNQSLSFARMIAEAHMGGIKIGNRIHSKGIEVKMKLYS